jgi:hypothetical protein
MAFRASLTTQYLWAVRLLGPSFHGANSPLFVNPHILDEVLTGGSRTRVIHG